MARRWLAAKRGIVRIVTAMSASRCCAIGLPIGLQCVLLLCRGSLKMGKRVFNLARSAAVYPFIPKSKIWTKGQGCLNPPDGYTV